MIFERSRYEFSDLYYDETQDITYLDGRDDIEVDSKDNVIYYTFKAGDRLDILAERFLNDRRLSWIILKANPQYFSELDIKIGDILIIPLEVDFLYE